MVPGLSEQRRAELRAEILDKIDQLNRELTPEQIEVTNRLALGVNLRRATAARKPS